MIINRPLEPRERELLAAAGCSITGGDFPDWYGQRVLEMVVTVDEQQEALLLGMGVANPDDWTLENNC